MLHNVRSAIESKADIRAPRPRRGNWMRLLGQVLRLAEGHGELIRRGERPWASVTFSGTRHTIALAFEGRAATAAAERLIDALSEHEFEIAGHVVADAQVREVMHEHLPKPKITVELEILLLEDL